MNLKAWCESQSPVWAKGSLSPLVGGKRADNANHKTGQEIIFDLEARFQETIFNIMTKPLGNYVNALIGCFLHTWEKKSDAKFH